MRIVTPSGTFESVTPDSEKAFEESVIANATQIFGSKRYYIDCKRRIGAKGGRYNIPDGFLIDLARKSPRLFVIENELASHDLYRHIGVQLLQFSLSYKQAGRQLKQVLFEEVERSPEVRTACEDYASHHGYRNLDYLLEYLVFDAPFQALVVIDEATDELHAVRRQFTFPVEVIEFTTYENEAGDKAFSFLPFLQDVEESIVSAPGENAAPDVSELDTVVVPAREDGFEETFIGESRWYAIRMHSSMIPQIKHIAAYRVAPLSAITHVAPVREIIPWEDTGKYCLEFAEPAKPIGPIVLDQPKSRKVPQAPRYTTLARLSSARTLADVF